MVVSLKEYSNMLRKMVSILNQGKPYIILHKNLKIKTPTDFEKLNLVLLISFETILKE